MTEPLAASSLAERLAHEGPLPADEALRLLRALCDALAPLHIAGTAHGGIWPARVQLVGEQVSLLESPQPAASPLFYMAPELLAGARPTPRSDVYALGALLYALLTGSDSEASPAPLSRLPAEAPRWLGYALRRALSAAPQERHANATALAEALSSPQLADQWSPPIKQRRQAIPDARDLTWRQKGIALALALLAVGALIALLRPQSEPATAYGFWALPSAPAAVPSAAAPSPTSTSAPAATASPTEAARTPTATASAATATLTVTADATTTPSAAATATTAVPSTQTRTLPPPSATPTFAASTPTATASRTPTRVPPTNTPLPPTATYTPTPDLYPAPVLTGPPDGFWGEIATLTWSWPNKLKDNEWFDVQVWKEGEEPQGIAWTKEPTHVVGGLSQGKYFWRIAVIQGRGGSWEKQLTPLSATWSFNRP